MAVDTWPMSRRRNHAHQDTHKEISQKVSHHHQKQKGHQERVTITDDNDDIDVTKMLGDLALDKNSPNFCLEMKDPWKRAAFIKTVNEIQFYKARVDIFLMAPVLPHHVRIDLSKDEP